MISPNHYPIYRYSYQQAYFIKYIYLDRRVSRLITVQLKPHTPSAKPYSSSVTAASSHRSQSVISQLSRSQKQQTGVSCAISCIFLGVSCDYSILFHIFSRVSYAVPSESCDFSGMSCVFTSVFCIVSALGIVLQTIPSALSFFCIFSRVAYILYVPLNLENIHYHCFLYATLRQSL